MNQGGRYARNNKVSIFTLCYLDCSYAIALPVLDLLSDLVINGRILPAIFFRKYDPRSDSDNMSSCHSRHTFTSLMLSAEANPSFIASQMRHENAKIVHEVYSKWIAGMNVHRVVTLSDRLQTLLPPLCPQA